MRTFVYLYFCLILSLNFFYLLQLAESHPRNLPANKLSIVYVYTVVPAVCQYGLPEYIKYTLEQAVFSQPDCNVVMASNYNECEFLERQIGNITGVIKVDISLIASEKTKIFANLSRSILTVDGGNELWLTSALRFFNMEDIMVHYNLAEMVHVEADNMLYGKLTSLLSTFRNGYRGLAATPLNSNKSFITASVFWIASLKALQALNQYLMNLATNENNLWKNYLKWLRIFACCKQGGIDPDENGRGIKPYAINEMSMLAYYHELDPNPPYGLMLLPVVPLYNYHLNRYVCNMSEFGPHGREAGPPTGNGIWDPNSWGQLIGGTDSRRGRDKGFTDASHIAGQAIRTSQCHVKMLCLPISITDDDWVERQQPRCFTSPQVRCGDAVPNLNPWTPLWNLHVHAKHTKDYL